MNILKEEKKHKVRYSVTLDLIILNSDIFNGTYWLTKVWRKRVKQWQLMLTSALIRQYCYSTGINVIDHASSSYDDKLHALTNIEGGKTFSRPWGLWHCFWKTEESLIQET